MIAARSGMWDDVGLGNGVLDENYQTSLNHPYI